MQLGTDDEGLEVPLRIQRRKERAATNVPAFAFFQRKIEQRSDPVTGYGTVLARRDQFCSSYDTAKKSDPILQFLREKRHGRN
jgi:hypothetical protein